MSKIQIRHFYSDAILFEYESENNTIKETLQEAVKSGVDLGGADLSGVDLRGVDLHYADLSYSNLRDANLYGANLRYADLSGADLYGADFRDANLYGADFRDANLYGADLSGIVYYGIKKFPHIHLACPSEGSFIGWKKVSDKLVKLEIPADAKRSSATTSKCRCSKAKVLAITDMDGENAVMEIINKFYTPLLYRVGEMVYPNSFDENRWNECSYGIHFFINKQEAIDYNL